MSENHAVCERWQPFAHGGEGEGPGWIQKIYEDVDGLIARMVTGAKKGNPVGKFWDGLFFSRVLEWGKECYQDSPVSFRKVLGAEISFEDSFRASYR